MQDSSAALLMEPETSLQAEESCPLIEDVDGIYNRIASRAFEIFERNGQLMGRDPANWLQAEVEFLHPLHIGVAQTSDAVTVRADAPGFEKKDLQIKVEPRRVTITGMRGTKK